MTNGWVEVRRTSATGSFSAYGVINDNGTNDGSFVTPTAVERRPLFMNVPVLVETGAFLSELVLTNGSSKPGDFVLTYVEALASPGPGNQSIRHHAPSEDAADHPERDRLAAQPRTSRSGRRGAPTPER